MSKYLNHTEHIASYLDGQMTPDQMQEFEKQLHTDPVLRSEFELQQDIIHTLRDYRKTQLKTRLDQVPVSMGPGGLVGIKAAAAIMISGVISLGAYLYFTTSSEPEIKEVTDAIEMVQQETETSIPEVTNENQLLVEPEVTKPEENVTTAEDVEKKPETESMDEALASTPKQEETQEVEKANPVINSPNLIHPDFEETDIEEAFEVPSSSLSQEGLADNSVVKVETANRDREMFHYQYFSGKLYLYGDFREQPYEILELNSSNGKRLFIYYNDDYFKIMDDQTEITPLEKLKDQDTIRKLEIIQANK